MQIVKYDKVVVSVMTDVQFRPPKGTVSLEAEISIIVPSTKGIRTQKTISKQEMDMRVNNTRIFLSKLFGGYTSVKGIGGYLMRKKDGRLIKENVVMVTSFGEEKSAKEKQDLLIKKLQNLCVEWQQETIGLIFETDMYLIERKKK